MPKAKIVFHPVLLLLLIISIFSLFCRSVRADDLKWSRVNTPSQGESGQWMLASGSDVRNLTRASDGTLFCCANPSSTPYRLFKSKDSGVTWSSTGEVQDDIVDIEVVPGKPDSVYYATESVVLRSANGGNTFNILTRNPGGAGIGNIEISSIDAAVFEGNEFVVIGTYDTDAHQFGGVYILDQGQGFDINDASIGNYDVYSVAFAPDFNVSGQIIAVATNETDTIITTRFYNSGWGDRVGNALVPGLTLKSAVVAFAVDYDSGLEKGKYIQFIALNSGKGRGDVYCLRGQAIPESSQIIDLDAAYSEGLTDLDIASLAVSGSGDNAYLIAGAASFARVYFSENSGVDWISSNKPPTGTSAVYICAAADFANSGIVYSASSGAESAFSISRDKGNNWSQVNLIDTTITNIKDLAVSPDYLEDNTLFLITGGTTDCLWYSSSGGLKWERIFSSAQPQVNRINLVTISPQYRVDKTILLAGIGNSSPVRWKSKDKGQIFQALSSTDPQSSAQVNIDCWTITPEGTLIIGSYDGSHGLVYQTTSSGLYYSDKAVVGGVPLNSIAVSPDYPQDKTLLVGNTNGEIFYSEGDSIFKLLPMDAPAPPLSGNVTLAFDPDYSRNKTVYAAGDSISGGIHRFIIGKSTSWEPVDKSLPAVASIGQVVTSAEGVLYGVYSRNAPGEGNNGGLERSLDPADNPNPIFETITGGIDDGISLRKLWMQGKTLWTTDATSGRLLTYTDNLTLPIILISPENNATGLSSRNIAISWESCAGAISYHWQVDTDLDFSDNAAGFQDDAGSTSVRLTELEPDTTYYWRVKAAAPVASPWSETRSFATKPDTTLAVPEISEPGSNIRASLKPNFRWSAVANATRYELQVSTDEGFSELIVDKNGEKACTNNVWNCEVLLKNDTVYYWRVRAANGSNTSDWAIGIFTTEAVSPISITPSFSPAPSLSVELLAPTLTPAITLSPSSYTPSESAESSGLSRTLIRLVIFLGAGMGVLIIGLVVVMIYVLRKFRKS